MELASVLDLNLVDVGQLQLLHQPPPAILNLGSAGVLLHQQFGLFLFDFFDRRVEPAPFLVQKAQDAVGAFHRGSPGGDHFDGLWRNDDSLGFGLVRVSHHILDGSLSDHNAVHGLA